MSWSGLWIAWAMARCPSPLDERLLRRPARLPFSEARLAAGSDHDRCLSWHRRVRLLRGCVAAYGAYSGVRGWWRQISGPRGIALGGGPRDLQSYGGQVDAGRDLLD